MVETSIIVPCYNQVQYLSEALESVLAQTYINWECIIVNDGSPDDTEAVAKKWCEKDNRFRYLAKKNGGLSSARNAGIRLANGKYILPLDADDKIARNYLKEAVDILNNDLNTALVYGEAEYFGKKTGKWELKDYNFKDLLLGNMIYCTALYRREDFDNYGPYDESFKEGWEDWDFWISLLKFGGSVFKIPHCCFYYRIKPERGELDKISSIEIQAKVASKIFWKHQDVYISYFGNPIYAFFERDKVKATLDRLKQSKSYKISNFLNEKFGKLLP